MLSSQTPFEQKRVISPNSGWSRDVTGTVNIIQANLTRFLNVSLLPLKYL